MVLLLPLGRIEEAIHQMQIAEKTDPLSPTLQSDLAWALMSAGRYEEAAGHCQKATANTECLGRARLAQGRIDEAIQMLATVKTRNTSVTLTGGPAAARRRRNWQPPQRPTRTPKL